MKNIDFSKIIGKHVTWEKLEGKPYASMVEKRGFGCLSVLSTGYRMTIVGDYGVSTSPVVSIENTEEGIKVKTKNSLYLVKISDKQFFD